MSRYYVAYCRYSMRPTPWVQSWSLGIQGCFCIHLPEART